MFLQMWQVAEPPLGESTAIDGATCFFQDMLYFVQVRGVLCATKYRVS